MTNKPPSFESHDDERTNPENVGNRIGDEASTMLLATALISGETEDILNALRNIEDAYERSTDNEALIATLALQCAEHPAMLERMDFWQSLEASTSAVQSKLYLALLRHIENMTDQHHADAALRARIMKIGYLGRLYPKDSGEEILEAQIKVGNALENVNDPHVERLLARMHYERHREPYARSEEYRSAVKGLRRPRDVAAIDRALEQFRESACALSDAIDALEVSARIDSRNGHTMFENQTRNRLYVLQLEGAFVRTEQALRSFCDLDDRYTAINIAELRAGDEQLLKRFHGNTLNRIVECHTKLGNEELAAVYQYRLDNLNS